jgi:hypothetical protein
MWRIERKSIVTVTGGMSGQVDETGFTAIFVASDEQLESLEANF